MTITMRATVAAFRAAHVPGAALKDGSVPAYAAAFGAATAAKQRMAVANGNDVDTTPGSPAWRPLA
jgi:hypothetical protein